MKLINLASFKKFRHYILAKFGRINSQIKLAEIYEQNNQIREAWKYYLSAAQKGNIDAQLKVAYLAISLNKDQSIIEHWLSKAINAEAFDSDKHVLNLTPDKLRRLELKPKTNNARRALLMIWNMLDWSIFEDWITMDHHAINYAYYNWGSTEYSRRTYISGLKARISDEFRELTAYPELEAKTALLAIELYHKIVARSQGYPDKNIGLSWPIINKLVIIAAPLIEEELEQLLTKLDGVDVCKILTSTGGLSEEQETIRDRIKMLANYNEACAQIYLDWYVKGKSWDSFYSAELQKIAIRFPALAPKLIEQLDLSNYTLELLTLKEDDDLEKILSKRYLYDMKSDDINTLLYENPVIPIKILQHQDGIKCLQNLRISLRQLAEKNIHVFLYLLENQDLLSPLDNLFNVFEKHLLDLDLEHAKLLLMLYERSHTDPLSDQPSLLKLGLRHPELLEWLAPKLKITVPFDPRYRQYIKNHIQFWKTLSWDALAILLRHFENMDNYILNIPSVLTLLSKEPLLMLSSIHWDAFKKASKVVSFTPDEVITILKNMPVKEEEKNEYFELLFSLISKPGYQTLLHEVSGAKPEFACDILIAGCENKSINIETQKELAMKSPEAAEYFFKKLMDKDYRKKLPLSLITEWVIELGTTYSSIAYEAGMWSLELENPYLANYFLKRVPSSHPQHQRALYERANIEFCIFKNKENALESLSQIEKTSPYYHPLLSVASQSENKAMTDLYLEISQDKEKIIIAENCSISRGSKSAALFVHQTKKITLLNLQEVWGNYKKIKQNKFFKGPSRETSDAYNRAKSPVFNDEGRFNTLSDYVLDPKNHHRDFYKALIAKFGKDSFNREAIELDRSIETTLI